MAKNMVPSGIARELYVEPTTTAVRVSRGMTGALKGGWRSGGYTTQTELERESHSLKSWDKWFLYYCTNV